jgi:hypothetical protein
MDKGRVSILSLDGSHAGAVSTALAADTTLRRLTHLIAAGAPHRHTLGESDAESGTPGASLFSCHAAEGTDGFLRYTSYPILMLLYSSEHAFWRHPIAPITITFDTLTAPIAGSAELLIY